MLQKSLGAASVPALAFDSGFSKCVAGLQLFKLDPWSGCLDWFEREAFCQHSAFSIHVNAFPSRLPMDVLGAGGPLGLVFDGRGGNGRVWCEIQLDQQRRSLILEWGEVLAVLMDQKSSSTTTLARYLCCFRMALSMALFWLPSTAPQPSSHCVPSLPCWLIVPHSCSSNRKATMERAVVLDHRPCSDVVSVRPLDHVRHLKSAVEYHSCWGSLVSVASSMHDFASG
jgi:hypothetical protein